MSGAAVLKNPYPWFGGKSRVAAEVWARFGEVKNYVEPFFGGGSVLLLRPDAPRIETINDLDGMVANFWRSVKNVPGEVAEWADWPVNENDLHARHLWLLGRKESLQARLEGDPDYYDAKIAGWWVWGICCWIGHGWCQGIGPWHSVDGLMVNTRNDGEGTWRKRPHLGDAGCGVNRKLPHLGDAGRGVKRQLPHLGGGYSHKQGIQRESNIREYMQSLSDRLRNVRVCCGDWSRVCGPSVTFKHGVTGVFLDPPYDHGIRDSRLYGDNEMSCASAVRDWAVANGDNPLMRIALCGYEGEHDMPESWDCFAWKSNGGYSSQGDGSNQNMHKERIWFSPHCVKTEVLCPGLC